jgi:hypothetical protein
MSNQDDVSRTQLPIPDVKNQGLITYDAKGPDTKFPPIRDLRPPKGSPNVLVILIDEFGSSRPIDAVISLPQEAVHETFHSRLVARVDVDGCLHQ